MAYASVSLALQQYMKVASDNNIYYGQNASGSPFLRCKKCSAVLVIGDMDYTGYGTDGTLDQQIFDYAKDHKHVKVPEVKPELVPRFDPATHTIQYIPNAPEKPKRVGRRVR